MMAVLLDSKRSVFVVFLVEVDRVKDSDSTKKIVNIGLVFPRKEEGEGG